MEEAKNRVRKKIRERVSDVRKQARRKTFTKTT
jgi:hypothetical protein